jgi:hypothetical protein
MNGKTAQTSISNQYSQSKARYELDRTINHYKELDTRTDSRPKQHKDNPKHNKKGTLITAIAIIIMTISTASAAASNIVMTTYGTYNKDEQRNKEDTVNRIKRATTTKPQGTGVCNADQTRNKDDETRQMGKQSQRETRHRKALMTEKFKQAKEHCRKTEPTRKRETTRRAQTQEKTRGTKSRA